MNLKNTEKGFTLVELLFVVVLLSILGVSVMKVIFLLEATSQSAEISRRSSETLASLTVSFRTQLLSRGSSNLTPINGNKGAQNVAGIQRNIIVDKAESGDSDMLRFACHIPNSFEPSIPGLAGEKEVRYYIDSKLPEKPLVLELWPLRSQTKTPQFRTVVLENVIAFDIRQWQGKAWTSDWSNPYGGAPRLLEITIKYTDGINGPKSTIRFSAPLGANS
jgi:prepilin-type N-terminal cleavage/methylation domain-containing protein